MAPSLAKSDAKGRPTISDLLTMVMVLPYSLSPISKLVLYAPIFSKIFTTASGVHGKMDFIVFASSK